MTVGMYAMGMYTVCYRNVCYGNVCYGNVCYGNVCYRNVCYGNVCCGNGNVSMVIIACLLESLSSVHQSTEELSSCSGVLIGFLKEVCQLVLTPGVSGNPASSCQSVCMLTR